MKMQGGSKLTLAIMALVLVGSNVVPVSAQSLPSRPTIVKPGSLGSVYFDVGSAKLSVAAKRTLAVWSTRLNGVTKIHVVGYVNPSANTTTNKRLSLARAKVVTAYLRAKGVKASITYTGAGGPKRNGNALHPRRAEVFVVALKNGSVSPSPSTGSTAKPTDSPRPTVSPNSSGTPTFTASPKPSQSPNLTLTSKPSIVFAGQNYVLSGLLSAIPSPTAVVVQQLIGSTWNPLISTTTNSKGRWSVKLQAPPSLGLVTVRAVSGKLNSQSHDIQVANLPQIPVAGPGARILGADISRWQHSAIPIDFKKMASSGVSFLFVKASDGNQSEDNLARPLANADAKAAKAAGIFVGYYHVARLPSTNTQSVVRASARQQANLALARLAELGGYDGKTLPYVLDIELAPKNLKPASITLWTRTWLEVMYQATARRPIIYSYRSYFSSKLLQDTGTRNYLRQYPMWLAHPGNPANPKIIPGKSDTGRGCFNTAWTLADCTASWSFWQYTSGGDREIYGIAWAPKTGTACPTTAKYCSTYIHQSRNHLDLNVFNGSISDLLALALGTWQQVPVPASPTPNPTPNPTPSN